MFSPCTLDYIAYEQIVNIQKGSAQKALVYYQIIFLKPL